MAVSLQRRYDILLVAMTRIANGEVDGLDTARDSVVLEKAINIARTALSLVGEQTKSPSRTL